MHLGFGWSVFRGASCVWQLHTKHPGVGEVIGATQSFCVRPVISTFSSHTLHGSFLFCCEMGHLLPVLHASKHGKPMRSKLTLYPGLLKGVGGRLFPGRNPNLRRSTVKPKFPFLWPTWNPSLADASGQRALKREGGGCVVFRMVGMLRGSH